jgi:hypothetical protein
MVGSPNATFSTTLAVLRPTPGRRSSAARSRGTWPPCSRSRISESAITFFAFMRNRPMEPMKDMSLSTPSCTIAAGVLATGKSCAVTLLTPLSVACADSTTATSSS